MAQSLKHWAQCWMSQPHINQSVHTDFQMAQSLCVKVVPVWIGSRKHPWEILGSFQAELLPGCLSLAITWVTVGTVFICVPMWMPRILECTPYHFCHSLIDNSFAPEFPILGRWHNLAISERSWTQIWIQYYSHCTQPTPNDPGHFIHN